MGQAGAVGPALPAMGGRCGRCLIPLLTTNLLLNIYTKVLPHLPPNAAAFSRGYATRDGWAGLAALYGKTLANLSV